MFYVHFMPARVPHSVERILATPTHEWVRGLYDDPFDLRTVELKKERGFAVTIPEPPDERERRLLIEAQLDNHQATLEQESELLCAQIFTDGDLSAYFNQVGNFIHQTTECFLELLRLKYCQFLIPDKPKIHWTSGYWVLPLSVLSPEWRRKREEGFAGVMDGNLYNFGDSVHERVMPATRAFLDRILPRPEIDVSPTVKPEDWSEIADQITQGVFLKPELSEVLIATALGECDPRMGNPRLALVEAVVALEIEVKSLMKDALKQYGLSDTAIERLVQENPLADLTSAWVRREI
jgi:hypothetical protein